MTESNAKSKIFSKKWLSFAALMLGAGTIYKLYFMDGVFYVQMQEIMGLSHTQIGVIYSVSGMISTFGFLAAVFITDRFSKKKMIPFALIVNGLAGFLLATFPNYKFTIVLFCVFAVCSDMLFWPTMLKAVRLLGSENEQGRMFGFLETGRGLIDTIVNFAALAMFAVLGSGLMGFRVAIIFYGILTVVIGIASFFLLEDDEIAKVENTSEKNKIVLQGAIAALKDKGIWLVAINVFMVYAVYSGIKYFVPFLNEIYAMPVVLVGAYGIVNNYVLKMVGGPIGGFISDKVTKSSAKFIQIMFVITAVSLFGFAFLPHGSMNVYVTMILALIISSFLFCMRAVYFAPMDEVKVPREMTGAAMGLGSFIGYLPGAFMGTIYGSRLDADPGVGGYKTVFIIMACISVAGFFISMLLINAIKKKQAEVQSA